MIAFGRIVGDGHIYFYIQDVIVEPQYQGNGVGCKIMDSLMHWWRTETESRGFLMLMAAEGKFHLYQKYGFIPRSDNGPGMMYRR